MSKSPQLYALLVIPYGALNPRSGGGQRSRLLFDGLKTMGPVGVVYIGADAKSSSGPEEFFPDADAIAHIEHLSFGPPTTSRFKRNISAAVRILFPAVSYRVRGTSRDQLNALIRNHNPSVVAFRYTRAFAVTGMSSTKSKGFRCAIDIDDRDDLKAASQLQDRFPSKLFAPFISFTLALFLRHLRRLWSKADLLWVAKQADVLSDLPTNQEILPNVPQSVPAEDTIIPAGQTGHVLLFVGSAGHRMNVEGIDWFIQNCWQKIRNKVPDARLRVVGLGDWTETAASYHNIQGVEIVGTVDDVATEYAIARVAICPIQIAAGSQIKIIEACSQARPVVATPLTASGFGQKISSEISSSSDADSFAQSCILYLEDSNLATHRGFRLRELQQSEFSRESAIALIGSAWT